MPTVILVFLILGLVSCPKVFGQDKALSAHVYMVICSGSNGHKDRVVQSGFRLKGTKGIVTALHGVVGATSIRAENDAGDVLLNLVVSRVDIDNDLALLTSEEILKRNDDGFSAEQDKSPGSGEKLSVYGHPLGIEINVKTVSVGEPAFKRLTTLIPPNSAIAFQKRGSPKGSASILYIEGNLVPGHSGAPVINAKNKIIGIVDGGLLGGAAAISWAIPIQNIAWENAYFLQDELKALDSPTSNALFASEQYTAPSVSILKPVALSDFGPSLHFVWGDFDFDETLEKVRIFYYVRYVRDFKISTISNCSLDVVDTMEFKYENVKKVNDWSVKELRKVTQNISIPLDKIIIGKLVLFENEETERGPRQKWGIQFSTKEKEIDFEETRVTKRLGFAQPDSYKETFSRADYFSVIGTRSEATDFLAKVRRLIGQCG